MWLLRSTGLVYQSITYCTKSTFAELVEVTATDAKRPRDLSDWFVPQESQHRLQSSVLFRGYKV